MTYPSVLERKYNEYRPFIEETAKRVKETLLNFCDSKGYALTSRIKTAESIAEKIETGRFKKWSDLDDLFACTIIVPSLSHETEVIDFCKETFQVVHHIKRGQNKKDPSTFRFDSCRMRARLKSSAYIEESSILSVYKVNFEIQVKSAFEHAWSVSTHDIVYKSSDVSWNKLRLAAQLKATVEQMDMLILAFEQTSTFIEKSSYPEIDIKCYIAVEVKKLLENTKIPDELKPKDISRFCGNLYTVLKKAVEEKDIKKTLDIVFKKINSTKSNQIPRSISLFQYFMTILIYEKLIDFNDMNHCWHITQEVLDLYPAMGAINQVFQYD